MGDSPGWRSVDPLLEEVVRLSRQFAIHLPDFGREGDRDSILTHLALRKLLSFLGLRPGSVMTELEIGDKIPARKIVEIIQTSVLDHYFDREANTGRIDYKPTGSAAIRE